METKARSIADEGLTTMYEGRKSVNPCTSVRSGGGGGGLVGLHLQRKTTPSILIIEGCLTNHPEHLSNAIVSSVMCTN